jgi:benzoate-CoA ligase family protein
MQVPLAAISPHTMIAAMKADDLPLRYNAVDVLERNLPARADRVALFSEPRQLTFGQVAAEVNRVGNALAGLGVRRGDTVALLAADSAEWVATYFAVIKLGAVVASFNTLLTPAEYRYMLDDCGARVLVIDHALRERIDPVRGQLAWLERIVVIGGPAAAADERSYAALVADAVAELAVVATHREDPCCLNYSSGTTGEPKGIPHAHKDLALTAELVGRRTLGLGPDDRTFAVAKLFFTFGTGGNLIFPWWVGASVVLFAGSPRVARDVLGVIARFRPTVFYTAPTGYAAMLAVDDMTTGWDLSSLRLCVSAGEALPAPVWQRWQEVTGLEIIDGIGSTENYHMFIANRPGEVRPGSSGKPIEGYAVRVVGEDGAEVPPGEVGNLLVRGETAALGYLHQDARSRRTFLGPWLDTGDKYRVDEDGYYWHAGRSDDMLKVGGIWVSPVEVESCLLGHPAVAECAVIGQPDRDELIKPKAFVVARDGVATDGLPAALIEHCAARMAPYKRPRWVELVAELPRTATGKIQRFRLRPS